MFFLSFFFKIDFRTGFIFIVALTIKSTFRLNFYSSPVWSKLENGATLYHCAQGSEQVFADQALPGPGAMAMARAGPGMLPSNKPNTGTSSTSHLSSSPSSLPPPPPFGVHTLPQPPPSRQITPTSSSSHLHPPPPPPNSSHHLLLLPPPPPQPRITCGTSPAGHYAGSGDPSRVWGARCKVQSARSRVKGARCKVQGAGCEVQGAGC